jgi:hypothetical protein
MLQEESPNAHLAGITNDGEGVPEDGGCQDRCMGEAPLDAVKGVLACCGPYERCGYCCRLLGIGSDWWGFGRLALLGRGVTLEEGCEWGCHGGKALDEAAEVIGQPQELPDVMGCLRGGPGCYRCHLGRIHLDAISSHNVAQVFDFSLVEVTLWKLAVELVVSEQCKHLAKVMLMLLSSPAEDEYVIQVDQTTLANEWGKYCVHRGLELGRGIRQAKWKHFPLELEEL